MGYQWGFKIIADFGTNFFVTFVPKLDHLRKTGTVEVEGGYDTPILWFYTLPYLWMICTWTNRYNLEIIWWNHYLLSLRQNILQYGFMFVAPERGTLLETSSLHLKNGWLEDWLCLGALLPGKCYVSFSGLRFITTLSPNRPGAPWGKESSVVCAVTRWKHQKINHELGDTKARTRKKQSHVSLTREGKKQHIYTPK